MSFSASIDVTGSVEGAFDVASTAVGMTGIAEENAKLIPIWPPDVPIVFSYNPEKMKASRKVNEDAARSHLFGTRFTRTSLMELNFFAYLEGPQTRGMAESLLSLTIPGESGLLGMIAGLFGVKLSDQLPIVMFMWGTYVIPECNVTRCTIDYERFHMSGLPLRAKCTIGLKEIPTKLPWTNPTSGGMPGREQHVVTAGESLPQLATRAYGRPAHWRDVAKANNVDDPFGVKPGANLFMPAPGELERRSGR